MKALLINKMNKIGAIRLPWGTLAEIGSTLKKEIFTLTFCVRLVKKLHKQ